VTEPAFSIFYGNFVLFLKFVVRIVTQGHFVLCRFLGRLTALMASDAFPQAFTNFQRQLALWGKILRIEYRRQCHSILRLSVLHLQLWLILRQVDCSIRGGVGLFFQSYV